ncbi:MAG TPA: WYL domain-containing protein [Acidimicrobiales bacterium]|nr:WYL domain-containing protein [Acidimicrobiales bacterium]
MSARRSDHGPRLTRLLAMVPWLLNEGGAPVSEIASRFGIDETEVLGDLSLVGLCGVPPYGGGDLIDIVVDEDGWVTAAKGPFFARPMRLTATEGFAVVLGGRALLAVPGADREGVLARALAKLEAVVGEGGSLAVDIEPPHGLAAVREGIAAHERLEVEYYTAWRDEVSRRRIDPLVAYSIAGRWYVDAHCHRAGGRRSFRVDRIRSVRATGEHFEHPEATPPGQAFTPGPDTRTVALAVPPTAAWVAESYPVVSVEERPDGRLEMVLEVTGVPWLERLLLRLGAEAEVVQPEDLRGVAAGAAARLLTRYRMPHTH